ncbi:MAG: class II glutamine amidotransferase [Candidatus Sumerlaea chitinivorans]|nr:class II glutamine amidotransferase [Candidatus Sumerlaea chitinivorans]
MCRMVGFVSKTAIPVAPFLKALALQAREGRECPHGDGWGMALRIEGHWLWVRQALPIWEAPFDALSELCSNIGIIHARKASPNTPINLTKVHPFVLPDPRHADATESALVFCHNGTVRVPERIPVVAPAHAIDSERYFALVVESLKETTSLQEAVKRAAQAIVSAGAQPSSLNCLLSDGESLIAHRGAVLRENMEYHTLYVQESLGCTVVSTEPLPDQLYGKPRALELGETVQISVPHL